MHEPRTLLLARFLGGPFVFRGSLLETLAGMEESPAQHDNHESHGHGENERVF